MRWRRSPRRPPARSAARREHLVALRPLVAQVLGRHEGFAAGAGVVLAPDALVDVPRCIEWWWADRGAGSSRSTSTPRRRSSTTTRPRSGTASRPDRPALIAGPYVDYICTHEYTFTISVPIVRDGRFAGVAGADILAGEVERMLLPGLSMLGRVNPQAVLVSGNGRVIASGTASIVPGTVLGRPARSPPPGPLPWMLLSGQALSSPDGD